MKLVTLTAEYQDRSKTKPVPCEGQKVTAILAPQTRKEHALAFPELLAVFGQWLLKSHQGAAPHILIILRCGCL